MKNNPVLIILLVFLVATSFFWFQVLKTKDLPVQEVKTTPIISGAEAESFIELAQNLLIDYKAPLPEMYGKDPFYKDYMIEIPEVKPEIRKSPYDVFFVSSVIYNKSNPLVVINGKILSEGDTIYDREFESGFMIEKINFNEVKINDGRKKYILKTNSKGSIN